MRPPDRFQSARFENYDVREPSQAEALESARAFVEKLRSRQGFTSRIRRFLRSSSSDGQRGLYLVGPVGTGKTHLLASMYHALHPEIPCAFITSASLYRIPEPPSILAERIARRYRVLCLDEVEADDPANEAKLVAILRILASKGVTVLATSNIEPERFVSVAYGNDRFRRFLIEQFHDRYTVVFVGGDDYRQRLEKTGIAWLGPAHLTREAMRTVYQSDLRKKKWITFDELLEASIETEHTALLRRLGAFSSIYIADISIRDTDDALRLLRIIDDLYLIPDPPVLHFTSETHPQNWFSASALHGSIAIGIAEKFKRTVSRVQAMCRLEVLADRPPIELKKSA